MPSPRFEVPTGAIDDVNTVFVVSRPYQPGSTAVFLNGQLKKPDLIDGWVETDPAAGVITLTEAPRSTGICLDIVQVFYLDDSPSLPEGQVVRLTGTIGLGRGRDLRGVLSVSSTFGGALSLESRLQAQALADGTLQGRLLSGRSLQGVISVCG